MAQGLNFPNGRTNEFYAGRLNGQRCITHFQNHYEYFPWENEPKSTEQR